MTTPTNKELEEYLKVVEGYIPDCKSIAPQAVRELLAARKVIEVARQHLDAVRGLTAKGDIPLIEAFIEYDKELK